MKKGAHELFLFTLGIAILYGIYKLWLKLQQKINYLTTLSNLVEHSQDIIYYCELKPAIKYRYLSPAIDRILSPTLVEESMKNPYTAFERIHPDDLPVLMKKAAGELDYSKPIIQRWKNDEDEYICFEEYSTPIYRNGQIVAIQGIIRNINDKVELQQQLEYKVSHDTLTDLYNRGYFESLINLYDKNEDAPIAILIFDLDELKLINDQHGHKMGDQLIKETAGLLKSLSDVDVIAARIGGDEFAVLMVNSNPAQAEAFIEEVHKEIDRLNSYESRSFKIKLSKGYAFNHSSLGKMEELFIEADNNMYRDKKRNRLAIRN